MTARTGQKCEGNKRHTRIVLGLLACGRHRKAIGDLDLAVKLEAEQLARHDRGQRLLAVLDNLQHDEAVEHDLLDRLKALLAHVCRVHVGGLLVVVLVVLVTGRCIAAAPRATRHDWIC